ncbi:signal peptidase II [Paraburkholderia sp. ZP32-5]|uniref:signal peptidase II n=1 Tax=Paraburkholderia sp. ZP32-5 TaxID=2883245 RepID=UPI001F45B4E6|nr:signal peptidase II [Paraburkholderia sp. ZP32-5]
MTSKQKLAILLLGALAWIVVDQLTKALFKAMLTPGDVVSLLAGSFLLIPIYNHGAFLSLGAGMSEASRNAVFIFGVLVIIVGLVGWVVRSRRIRRLEVVAVACIVGGGISNLLDRCFYGGGVFDFLNLGIGYVRTGVFNVADVGIMLGVVLLLLNGMKRKPVLPDAATS